MGARSDAGASRGGSADPEFVGDLGSSLLGDLAGKTPLAELSERSVGDLTGRDGMDPDGGRGGIAVGVNFASVDLAGAVVDFGGAGHGRLPFESFGAERFGHGFHPRDEKGKFNPYE